jgi:hypothetical protein
MLMNMHYSPAEGNFCDEHGNALKLPWYKTIRDTWGTWTRMTA